FIFTAPTFNPVLNDTAVGVDVELLFGDVVARRLSVWWQAGAKLKPGDDRSYGFYVEYENEDLLCKLDPADPRWKLRVRSDPLVALRAGNAAYYWSGDVEAPLNVS